MNLTIAWLYPELMSTYGDRGNIIILTKRCQWRSIDVEVLAVDSHTTQQSLCGCDIIIGGGAQDRQQTLVIADLRQRKKQTLRNMFDAGIPGLFVCGSPQLLGHSIVLEDTSIIEGLGILDITTKHPTHKTPRCVGTLVGELCEPLRSEITACYPQHPGASLTTLVGFENHGGRTVLGNTATPLARVLVGKGNNGQDGTEGVIYNHCIATYSHGPFLASNPHVADWLISTALKVKYNKAVSLSPLADEFAWKSHAEIRKKSLGKPL